MRRGQVCAWACGEHVAADRGEHAGLVVRNHGPVVVLGCQGEPAEFVEREDVRAGDAPDAVERRAGRDLGHLVGNVGGSDRLKAGRGQADRGLVGGL